MKEGWIRGNSNKRIPARLTFTGKRTFDSVIDFIIIIVVAFVFFCCPCLIYCQWHEEEEEKEHDNFKENGEKF